MSLPDFELLIARASRALARAGISHMLIGGQALLVHGEPRFTRDVDLTLGAGPEGIPALLAAAAEAGLRPLPQAPEAFARESFVLPCLDPGTKLRVDFILSTTPYEREAIGRARPETYAGRPVPVATAEDLLLHKVFAGRPRDLEDARSVARRNAGRLDIAYLRRWAAEFANIPGRQDSPGRIEELLR